MLAVGLVTQITGFLLLSAAVAGLDGGDVGGLGGAGAGHLRRGQGPDQDRQQIGHQADRRQGSGSGQLFRWVAWFTGSKNAMKGVGFFLGGLLLERWASSGALWAMAGAAGAGAGGVWCCSLPPLMGKARPRNRRASCSPRTAASTCWPPRASCCSARATCGSWSACRCSSTPQGWTFTMVGGFLAPGPSATALVQAAAPALVRAAPTA
jgi:hypothetical protein